MAPVVAALVLLACLLLSLLPLLRPSGAPSLAPSEERDPREALLRARRRLLDGIREIDMDLVMGKVSESDHAELRAGLETEALAVLSQLGELEGEGAGE